MKKRQRKKWQKKNGTYVSPSETFSLDYTIAKFVYPRLVKFRQFNNGYPGHGEMDTPEKWDEALDKMILAFKLLSADDYFDKCWYENGIFDKKAYDKYQSQVDEGLLLFAKWYQNLWW